VTIVVLTFVIDLCGVWHVAYTYFMYFRKFFGFSEQLIPKSCKLLLEKTIFECTESQILTDF